jgi:hypothetical protein
VAHVTGLETVHVHPAVVVTEIVPVPPEAGRLIEAGLTVNTQGAACVTVKAFPPIVSVALRDAVVELAATVNPTLPLPLPEAPLEIVTHEAALVADQAQPAVVVSDTVPLPPAAATDWLAGEMVNEQLTAPACVTVKVSPPMVSVPTRPAVPVFAEYPNVTAADPDPDAADVSVIHEALLAAVHAHPAPAVTVVLPEPAAAVADWLTGEIDGSHGGVNENELERAPALTPPGPTADTSVSYVTPFASGAGSRAMKSRRIIPSVPGVGFPRLTVCTGVVPPARTT